MAMKIAEANLPVRPILQVLICPVIDNTADTTTYWENSMHSPWLSPQRMNWYRQQYFGVNKDSVKQWSASPNFAPAKLLSQNPKTFIAVADCDLLCPEGKAYGVQLKQAGVDTEVKSYKGATHSALVLAGAHSSGKEMTHDACERMASALGMVYDRSAATIEQVSQS
jgi:acetyl esterase/lipase